MNDVIMSEPITRLLYRAAVVATGLLSACSRTSSTPEILPDWRKANPPMWAYLASSEPQPTRLDAAFSSTRSCRGIRRMTLWSSSGTKTLRHRWRIVWQAKLKAVATELRQRLQLIPEVGAYLRAVVRGHVQYYGVPMNTPALCAFRHGIGRVLLVSRSLVVSVRPPMSRGRAAAAATASACPRVSPVSVGGIRRHDSRQEPDA
jgi:hypothetical protein